MVTLISVLLQIMHFTLTCFIVHSLYYSQIIHITTIKIIAMNMHCNISFFCFLIGCFVMAFVRRTKGYLYVGCPIVMKIHSEIMTITTKLSFFVYCMVLKQHILAQQDTK
jgi:hypothetical protein